jgi:hypothetical protein
VSTPKLTVRKHAYHGADTLLNRAVEEARLNRNLYVIALEAEVERLTAVLTLIAEETNPRGLKYDADYETAAADAFRLARAALPREEGKS